MTKILVAEDDKFLANAYRIKLTKAGFDVLVVSDGQEAINALAGFDADLIILDLIMPVKDGFITLQDIRANPAHKMLPVIVASNLGQKEDIDKAMQLGASGYMVKSDLKLNDIIAKINTLLSRAS